MNFLDLGRLSGRVSEEIIVRLRGRTIIHERQGSGAELFALMCLSKPLFALAVLNFVEQSSFVELDEPLREYFPDVLQGPLGHLSIADLLTHRSGVSRDSSPGSWSQSRYLQWIAKSPIESPAPPAYTVMTGWLLLAVAVEGCSGLGRTEFLDRYLSVPIGARLGYGAISSEYPAPLDVVDMDADQGLRPLRWASDGDVLERAWPGTGVRASAVEVAKVFERIARNATVGSKAEPLDLAISRLVQRVGGGLSTDGEGKHSFGYSYGALVGSEWIGQRNGRTAVGFDSGTGSFALADRTDGLVIVYLSNLVREPLESLLRRRHIVDAVERILEGERSPWQI